MYAHLHVQPCASTISCAMYLCISMHISMQCTHADTFVSTDIKSATKGGNAFPMPLSFATGTQLDMKREHPKKRMQRYSKFWTGCPFCKENLGTGKPLGEQVFRRGVIVQWLTNIAVTCEEAKYAATCGQTNPKMGVPKGTKMRPNLRSTCARGPKVGLAWTQHWPTIAPSCSSATKPGLSTPCAWSCFILYKTLH